MEKCCRGTGSPSKLKVRPRHVARIAPLSPKSRRLSATCILSKILLSRKNSTSMSETANGTVTDSGVEDASTGENLSSRHVRPSGSRRPRGRTGCLNCRRRRKKCDERKPTCAKCKHLGERCEWESGAVTFRLSGIDSAHPSMKARKLSNVAQDYQMVDVTFDSSTHRRIEHRTHEHLHTVSESLGQHDTTEVNMKTTTSIGSEHQHSGTKPESFSRQSSDFSQPLSPHAVRFGDSQPDTDGGMDKPSTQVQHTNFGPAHHQSIDHGFCQTQVISPRQSVSSASIPANSILHDLDDFTATELGALDYLTSRSGPDHFQTDGPMYWSAYECNPTSPSFDLLMSHSPDMFSTYYPNAEYRNLHTTLYNHMVETARGTGLTGQGTPETEAHDALDQGLHPSQRPLPKGMSLQRETILWRNYLDEIADWLDMFDNDRHFRNSIPLLAQSSSPLRFSILALSARQMERRDPDKPYTESLGLYQEAIQLIVPDLQTMDTAVIASCVLLCVLEMMSSSPREWARHLDGCAMLMKAAGINGVSGGESQAIFWCFARMDMWGGFLTDTNTKIPTSLWFLPSGSMSAAVDRFKAEFKSFDQYANYAVFLCASAMNVISNDERSSYNTRWKSLFDLLEDWYSNRPPEMRPLISRSDDTGRYPFPSILFTNSAAVSGNQLYHAAALLMLQGKPKETKIRSYKSIFWHARQICGITASNSSQ